MWRRELTAGKGGLGMKSVCPLPTVWHRIHLSLLDAWKQAGSVGEAPPTPLILAGWAFSNDVEKHVRWEDTVAWARAMGLSCLVEGISEEDTYRVAEMSSHEVGPFSGPGHLAWSCGRKPALSQAARGIEVAKLVEAWGEVAGPGLCVLTAPLRLTGRKGRRLLVAVVAEGSAPWGSWQELVPGVARQLFTDFRHRVNSCIAPHSVDHIDFIELREEASTGVTREQ